MTDAEVEVVARKIAERAGFSWTLGTLCIREGEYRHRGMIVLNRGYWRESARAAIAALDQARAKD